MDVFNMKHEEFEKACNNVKNAVIASLYKKDLISYETYRDYTLNHGILVRSPSYFHKFWKKSFGHDNLMFIVIKQESFEENDDNDVESRKKKPDLKIIPFNGKDEDK